MRHYKTLFMLIFSVCLLGLLKSQVLYISGGSRAIVQSPSFIGIGAPLPLALLNVFYDSAVAAAIRLEGFSGGGFAPLNDYKLGVIEKIRANVLTLSESQLTIETVASNKLDEFVSTQVFIDKHWRLSGFSDHAEGAGLDLGQVTMQITKTADQSHHVIKLERRVLAQEELISRLEQLVAS